MAIDETAAVAPEVAFTVPRDPVTRLLCASAHLRAAFANHVHDELVEPAHRAMAPNWNIDTLLLARHAEQARNRRLARDSWLLVVFLLALIGVVLSVQALLNGWLSFGELVLLIVLILAAAYAAGFGFVWVQYSAVHRSALAVMGTPGSSAVEPSPLDPDVENELYWANRANVILFSGPSPFIGSGPMLDRWAVNVDISLGSPRAHGTRARPEDFDAPEFHAAMLAAIPLAIQSSPESGHRLSVVSGHRLYVIGAHAPSVGGLFRAGPVPAQGTDAIRWSRPVSTVPPSTIEAYMRKPANSARPYTYFQLTGWDGHVVLTLFLRSVVAYPMMHVELAVCALRPPQAIFGEVTEIPLGPGVHRLPVLRSALPRTLPLLLRSPARAWRYARSEYLDRKARRDLELTLRQRNDVNFSAGPSLREEVARPQNALHFGHVDEEMFYRVFERASMDCIRDWLVQRDIDVADFDRQRSSIEDGMHSRVRAAYGPVVPTS